MSEELKPCPFVWCGAKAVLEDDLISARGTASEFTAGCRECDIYTPQCATAEEAIKLWNTRAETPQSTGEREAIVAWLRDLNARDKSHNYYFVLANRIERGEHLSTRQDMVEGEGQ
jgi:hypothetical protein